MLAPWKKGYDQPRGHTEKQRSYFANKSPSSQSYGFSSSHAMTYLDSVLKSRDITLPTKVHLVKAMVFPTVCMDVRVGL